MSSRFELVAHLSDIAVFVLRRDVKLQPTNPEISCDTTDNFDQVNKCISKGDTMKFSGAVVY